MKKFLLIFSVFIVSSTGLFAQQDDDSDGGNEKIRDKMNEYIQKRLNLSNDEAKKFSPIFLNYFREWKQTVRDNKGDVLERQKKVVDLRLSYRTRFREVIGEQRANQVFNHQEAFIQELRQLRRERMNNGPRRNRANALTN